MSCKYQNALLEMARHKHAVKLLNKAIHEALDASYKALPKELQDSYEGKNHWLELAYQPDIGEYGSRTYAEPEDIEYFLSEKCKFALNAHRLIQDRKRAKQKLAIANRLVTLLGNRLLNETKEKK